MSQHVLRRHLSMPGLLSSVRQAFAEVPDGVRHRRFRLSDCLMSGLAMLILKDPSLRQFDKQTRSDEAAPTIVHNLKTLFGIKKTPSDTGMRKRLDLVVPPYLRGAYRAVHRALQRGKALEGFTVLGGHFLLPMDGTGFHSSSQVHCSFCFRKTHRDGSVIDHHQLFAGALWFILTTRWCFPSHRR